MRYHQVIFCLLLAARVANGGSRHGVRHLQDNTNDPDAIWGYQQGAADGHTDAGGMIYDIQRDELILVGTTHDNQFFNNDGANSVDCFIATIRLPSVADELSAKEVAESDPLAAAAEAERVHWDLSGKFRVASLNELDRCDLITAVWSSGESTAAASQDHMFVGGTYASNTNSNRDPIAVQPMVFETMVKNFEAEGVDLRTDIEIGDRLDKLFDVQPFGATASGQPLGIPKKDDIIIPAMMAGHGKDVYIASIHRILVLSRDEIGSPNATPKLQISLGIAKFNVANDVNTPLVEEWNHIEPTSILEVKADQVPHVTSGMFKGDPGMSPAAQHEMQIEQEAIEEEINEIEAEQEAYEEEAMQMDVWRHQYKNDGVLISGLEFVDMGTPSESFLLIAGSAPGTNKELYGEHNNHSMASNHPFMPHAPDYKSTIGDWDGYVAKLSPNTGAIAQANVDINTWGYRLHTQPKRDDFIQSICVPQLPPGMQTNEPFFPQVAYAVGTTQGKMVGDQYGGAFIVQLDLTSMDVLWQQQIPGMNVHGMACQVLVDVASHGTTIRADSKDLIYVTGEVHGQMKVPMQDGSTVLTHGHGETDVWVAQLRASDGKVNWVQQVGTDQQDRLAKNINNPSVSDGEQSSDIGETGSGKGALVLDREGNAIVYGTTNGSLGRTKGAGDRFRDIFVVRLHRDDGSYKAIVEPHKFVTEHTPAPIGSGPGTTSSSSTPSSSGSSTTTTSSSSSAQTSNTPPPPTHKGATTDTSANLVIIIAGLAVPVVLGIVIILATNRRTPRAPPSPMHGPSTPMGGTDLHVGFPSERESSPPSATFPPGVEQSLEMSPTPKTTETFGIL